MNQIKRLEKKLKENTPAGMTTEKITQLTDEIEQYLNEPSQEPSLWETDPKQAMADFERSTGYTFKEQTKRMLLKEKAK